MKKLVIFDLDGTLLNTIADLAQAANHTLLSLGFPIHEEKAYYRFVGNGVSKLLERSLPKEIRSEKLVTQAKEIFMPYYDRHNTDLTKPYDGIVSVLENLQKQHILLAVASNKYQSATEKLVQHFFPTIHFTQVLGQRESVPAKPDPFVVKEILSAAQIKPKEALYVGDSVVDMQTAQRAKVSACAVSWGFSAWEQLAPCLPDFIARKPEEILKFIH